MERDRRDRKKRENMDYSTLFLWISLAWAFIHIVLLAKEKSSAHKLPPGPIPLPIIGSLFKLGHKPHDSLARLAKIYGPIMTLRLGRVLTVIASSADMAKEVLQKNDQALSGRTVVDAVRAQNYHESTMGWQPANSNWRKLRMMYNTQMFTAQRLDANQALRRQKVQELIAHMRQSCLGGQVVDIGRAAFVTTLNLLSNSIFSVDLVNPSSESVQEFKDAVHGIMEEAGKPNLSDYFPLLRPLDPLGIRRRMTAHFKKLYQIFDKMIDERLQFRASSESPRMNDFLDVLLDQSHENELSRSDINALLTEIFSAGSDTSSSTIEWAMAELLRNPNVLAKARSELIQTIGSEHQVEESDIARLPYIQAIVKETLRLHPPVPLLIPHRAETGVEICGCTIPRHTQVFVNVWAIGRDPSIWRDPTSFKPERFVGSEIDLRGRDFELMPFGAGRRICPGLPLGLRMVNLMLASLLHSFGWKLPDGVGPQDMDMSDKFGITLQMAVPLRAIPVQAV
ncbi:geraniol 8-hydroxylase-like [Magnolia sinica]|uniref:geraniol 8-hydroxylase-like n=1 Tax=Magnolia sinica TaxID=86752 RepID=UPI0026581A9B|nr:geraniol 8-hydroxylase-like [Magnolia sinica]